LDCEVVDLAYEFSSTSHYFSSSGPALTGVATYFSSSLSLISLTSRIPSSSPRYPSFLSLQTPLQVSTPKSFLHVLFDF
jgi:hypothetical protein